MAVDDMFPLREPLRIGPFQRHDQPGGEQGLTELACGAGAFATVTGANDIGREDPG